MKFHPNASILFILAGAIIVFVIAQSLFFLIRAYRRGKELGSRYGADAPHNGLHGDLYDRAGGFDPVGR